MKITAPLLLAATLFGASECGPTHRQVGEAVLITWPLVLLLALGAQYGLLALWRRKKPDVEREIYRVAPIFGVALLVSFCVVFVAEKPWRWADAALWLWGCSYGSVLLLLTRLWLIGDPKRALFAPHVVTSLLFVPLAAALYRGFGDGVSTDFGGFFIVPGMGGWVTGGVFLALLVEIGIRLRRNRSVT